MVNWLWRLSLCFSSALSTDSHIISLRSNLGWLLYQILPLFSQVNECSGNSTCKPKWWICYTWERCEVDTVSFEEIKSNWTTLMLSNQSNFQQTLFWLLKVSVETAHGFQTEWKIMTQTHLGSASPLFFSFFLCCFSWCPIVWNDSYFLFKTESIHNAIFFIKTQKWSVIAKV